MSLGKTKGLHRILEDQGDLFEKKYTHNGLPMSWIRQKRVKLRNRIGAKKSFYNGEGEKNRMELNLSGANPKSNPGAKAFRNTVAAEERGRGFEAEKKNKAGTGRRFAGRRGFRRKRNGKRPSKLKNLATSYEETMYRGAEETVFFLLPLGENGEPITNVEGQLWGYFVQEEAKKTQLSKVDGCLFCRLGREKKTGQVCAVVRRGWQQQFRCRCPRRGPRS